ncbi:ABC transporter ATP-binding protein [Halomarina oriensis]|uniref:Nickel import system ATP-binding protein NikD n=1 Tax=Halomarina oriensis TaxID=671145 RepID=A0A6B0GHP5_9EURY|nr:ABC transporter ATP-binding protein [Halomarina oriensis]MWG34386.1 ATP-binding cassette domain-containing protein [Halomarina oriensis]
MSDPLISVKNLHTQFHTDDGTVRAVDGIDVDVSRGETVCIVGESGSGKTVTSESITKILQMPPGDIPIGEVQFRDVESVRELADQFPKRVFDVHEDDAPGTAGTDVPPEEDRPGDEKHFVIVEERSGDRISRGYIDMVRAPDNALRKIRGGDIAHIFQNPQSALNPVYTVGWQIVEAVQLHSDDDDEAARERAIDLLDRVGIPDAAARFDDYPHEFSGGMKQRVIIAMALASNPDVLIADEPTTALDVTIQAQILDLLAEIQEDLGMAILFITHDLGVVAEIADRVVVMYAGKVMESGEVFDLFESPAHPYTRALLECLPGRGGDMVSIGGSLPSVTNPPDGCRFAPRCPHAVDDCFTGDQPPMYSVEGADQEVSCVFYGDGYDESVVQTEFAAAQNRTARTDGGRTTGRRAGTDTDESVRSDGGDR